MTWTDIALGLCVFMLIATVLAVIVAEIRGNDR